jgi:hypothetical protein
MCQSKEFSDKTEITHAGKLNFVLFLSCLTKLSKQRATIYDGLIYFLLHLLIYVTENLCQIYDVFD